MYKQVIQNPKQAEKFYAEILRQLERTEKPLLAVLSKYEPQKTGPQNRFFHKLVGELAMEMGETPKDMKGALKETYGFRIAVGDSSLERLKSISHYNRKEMAYMIDRVYQFAAEQGIVLESAR